MNREYYEEEMMLKEAITSHKSDQEIGMPDINAELSRVKQSTANNEQSTVNKSLPLGGDGRGLRRIAAAIILVLSISGLAWALVYYQNHKSDIGQQTIDNGQQTSLTLQQPADTTIVKASKVLNLSYEKASLEQIVVDLSAFYHLDQPTFRNLTAARHNMMHITFNQKATIQDAVDLLNTFSSVNVELKDNRIIVK